MEREAAGKDGQSAGPRKVLVTGTSGYLAGFVVERLRPSFEVTLFDRAAPPSGRADLRFIQGDITDKESVGAAFREQDAVVHLAAPTGGQGDTPESLYADVMAKGTWHVAQAATGRSVELQDVVLQPILMDAPT